MTLSIKGQRGMSGSIFFIILFDILFITMSALIGSAIILTVFASYLLINGRTEALRAMPAGLDKFAAAFIKNQSLLSGAIITFIFCGVAGVFVDIDHVPEILMSFLGYRFPGRTLHPLFFIIGLALCIWCGYRLCRYYNHR